MDALCVLSWMLWGLPLTRPTGHPLPRGRGGRLVDALCVLSWMLWGLPLTRPTGTLSRVGEGDAWWMPCAS